MIQSWQADLLNLQLSLTVKPIFRYVGSLPLLRAAVRLSDNTLGRLAIPGDTRREPAHISGAEFDAEWLQVEGPETGRTILYLPGGAYVLRMPSFHSAMAER